MVAIEDGLIIIQSFSDYILSALSKGISPTLYQDVFYTPILAEELVQAVHDLKKQNASGIFHVVGDERLSKYEFGLKLATRFQLDSNLVNPVFMAEQNSKVRRPLDMSLSNKKTCQLLGRGLGGVDEHLNLLELQYSNGPFQEIVNL